MRLVVSNDVDPEVIWLLLDVWNLVWIFASSDWRLLVDGTLAIEVPLSLAWIWSSSALRMNVYPPFYQTMVIVTSNWTGIKSQSKIFVYNVSQI